MASIADAMFRISGGPVLNIVWHEMQAKLKQLMIDTDTVLATIRPEDMKGTGNAVNWASLNAYDASFVISEDGKMYYRVEVEEAEPKSAEFCAVIEERLLAMGWHNIRVYCDW